MSDEVYYRLAKTLDTLPNGFPATKNGLEIRLLKTIFKTEQAELFPDLRLEYETPEQIAQRTGRPLEGLENLLVSMWDDGQVFGIDFGEVKVFKMLPWAFGIYEFQVKRMTREMAELMDEYGPIYGRQFFDNKPQLMQVIPVEREIEGVHEALPYERVSNIIEKGQAFAVNDCICKKEKAILDQKCDKPLESCMAIAPVPNVFDSGRWGKPISKEEAYGLLETAEKAGLVHLTWNMEDDHFFICNCCGCCCGVLRSINELGILHAVNSYYVARIDPVECISCGVCADERCQVKAIEEVEDAYKVITERCIGCGLCVSTCPSEAISLVRKAPEDIEKPPKNEKEWFAVRGNMRGVDFSKFQ